MEPDNVVLFFIIVLILVVVARMPSRLRKSRKKQPVRLQQRSRAVVNEGEHSNMHDLWVGRHQNIPLKFYGGGAEHAFEHYFSRPSQVDVASVEDIVTWLIGCQYVSDPVQFRKRDYWQHPVDFEQTRRGDCEDFALWTWRKLIELGYEAEFMVGKWIRGERVGTHAWVMLEHEGERFLLETTGRARERVIRTYEEAYKHYIPFASVDHSLKKKVYNGIAHWIMSLA